MMGILVCRAARMTTYRGWLPHTPSRPLGEGHCGPQPVALAVGWWAESGSMGERFGGRRRATRYEIVGRLVGRLEAVETLPVVNLSRGGLCVRSAYPLPVEVIPMARGLVARAMVAFGGAPEWRQGFTTDNGNLILDVHELAITDPADLETKINNIAGVVTNGIFAAQAADLVLVATANGVERF